MNWFDGIDDKLAPGECEILARMELEREQEEKLSALIDRAREQGREERLYRLIEARRTRKVVSPYPGHDLYSRLRARRDREADLALHLENIRVFAFEPVIVGDRVYHPQSDQGSEEDYSQLVIAGFGGQPRKWLEPYNLPAKKQAYNRLKNAWQRAGLTDYTQDAQRFLCAQDKEKESYIEQLDKQVQQGSDPEKAAQSAIVVRELYKNIQEYV